MNFGKEMFASVNRRYLIRAYLISFTLLVWAIWYFSSQAGLSSYQKGAMYGYSVLSAVLFPFAKLVWDELKETVLGNNQIVHFGWWAIGVNYMLKAIVNILLWYFAILIAPFGILYLHIQNRRTENSELINDDPVV